MLQSNSEFFNVLPDKHCAHCNEPLTEMADCYATVCEQCAGAVFYPLSPVTVIVRPES